MPNRHSPCGPCCCEIFTDDFNRSDDTDIGAGWDEVSGDWEIASNKLAISGPGVVLATKTGPTFQVRFSFDAPTSFGTMTFRVIVDYVDANNYHYAEVISDSPNASISVQLFRMDAGTPIELTARYDRIAFSGNGAVRVCFSDGLFTASDTNSTADRVSVVPSAHGGNLCGIETVTVGNDYAFDNFFWNRDRQDCVPCVEPWFFCSDPIARAQIEIPELTDPGDPDCCDEFAGTYGTEYFHLDISGNIAYLFVALPPPTCGGDWTVIVLVVQRTDLGGGTWEFTLGLTVHVVTDTVISWNDVVFGLGGIKISWSKTFTESTPTLSCAALGAIELDTISGGACDTTESAYVTFL